MNQENPTLHYGLTSFNEALTIATKVCDALGHGRYNKAVNLLLEVACVETQLGTYQDPTPKSAGMGLTQGDPIGVKDVVKRTRYKDVQIVKNCFGFDVRELKHSDLANSPVKAFVLTRLKFKLRPEPIPSELKWRARYWKKFYNSVLGKGTIKHYVAAANRWLYGDDSPLFEVLADMNKVNKDWFNRGRKARFAAEKQAAISNQLPVLPESSFNATAHSYWRRGWNSVTKQDLQEILNNGVPESRSTPLSHISAMRNNLGVNR